MERNKLNLQTVLFRPLRSRQCSSEWFENWDMSTAQRAINTSHTDKQWHILFLNTRVLKLKGASNAYIYISGWISQKVYSIFSSQIYIYIYISGWIFQKVLAEIVQKDLVLSQKALISNRRNLGLFAPTSMRFPSRDSKPKDLSF